MNCEQVEELLSAYLDDSLTVEETAEAALEQRHSIAAHLQDCVRCRTTLADFRRFDTLLAQMPRISPSPALREKIFTSPDYFELTGIYTYKHRSIDRDHIILNKNVQRDTPGRPQLVALPGGRRVSASTSPTPSIETPTSPQPRAQAQRRGGNWGLRIMQTAIVASLLLTLGVGSLISWKLWAQNAHPAVSSSTFTPPAAPASGGPLSAGIYYVFLRDGSLWSAPADGSSKAERLTPESTTVADGWVVSPPLPGRSAGDKLAYIDLQQAFVHTLRSDGQSDTVVPQPLLKAGIAPSLLWDTSTGEAILNSMTWSKDGSMLAFVADPTGANTTSLYILSTETGSIQLVPLPIKGSVSHPVWSPDGRRIAFAVNHNGIESIVDYNTQNHGLLNIANNVNVQGSASDTLLNLDWSPDVNTPVITWSVGSIGHVHSLWVRHVGNGGNAFPQELSQGDYVQAIYSRTGRNDTGSWLFVTSYLGRAANLVSIDLTPGAIPAILTSGKQVNFAQWSPDGTYVDYLDSISSGVGTLHVVNVNTAADMLVSAGVTNDPAPAWSADGQQLVYNTGKQSVVVDVQGSLKFHPLKIRGLASLFSWSVSSPHQLVIALNDGQTGVYLVDTQRNTVLQLDQQAFNSPILWTEIP
jgi:Tol biopolymer transport system component